MSITQPQEGNSTFFISILNLQVSDGLVVHMVEGSSESEIPLTVNGETPHTIQKTITDVSHRKCPTVEFL